jgi:hypothetical protein
MSNQLGTLNSALILQEALSLVYTIRPELKSITLDLDPMGALQNQTVISRLKTIPTVVNGTDAIPDVTTTDVPVTLSYDKKVGATFTAAQLNSTNRNLIREMAEPIARAMANYMVDAVAALWLKANYANETVQATPDYTTMVDLRKALVFRGIHGDRFAAVSSDVYALLLEDPRMNRFYKAFLAPGTDPIEQGELIQTAGFARIFEYPAIPTGENLIGFAGTKESVILASRPPLDPREAFGVGGVPFPGNFEIISDPVTGMSAAAVEWIDPQTLACQVYLKWIFGVAKGNSAAGQRLVSSAT